MDCNNKKTALLPVHQTSRHAKLRFLFLFHLHRQQRRFFNLGPQKQLISDSQQNVLHRSTSLLSEFRFSF
jgi:hypothetical protein